MQRTVWEREICNGETARANVDLTISIVHANVTGNRTMSRIRQFLVLNTRSNINVLLDLNVMVEDINLL